jgi:hypothetical protein
MTESPSSTPRPRVDLFIRFRSVQLFALFVVLINEDGPITGESAVTFVVPFDYGTSMVGLRRVARPRLVPQPPAGFRAPGRNLPPRRPGALLITNAARRWRGFAAFVGFRHATT